MPVFFALYWVLQASVEMRGAPWVGWITDLTQPDPYFILPILYAVSMYITTKLNPQPTDPVQARVFQFLPILFTFMLAPFSAGLVIYWAWSNILSIAQQYTIMRRHGTPIGSKGKPAVATVAPVPASATAPADGGGGGKKGKAKKR